MSASSQEGHITINQAVQLLDTPKKHLENYIKVGKEIPIVKIGRRIYMSQEKAEEWKRQRGFGYSKLNRDDYMKCLDFAIKSFYDYESTSDFGTTTQRDAGKFISNFVSGKLGEISVQMFLKRNFDIDTDLDFGMHEAVVGQDITGIALPRRGGRVINPPRQRIAIKATKMKNVWLIVPAKEADDVLRNSDIYILSRVDLYLDHLIRILREHPSLQDLTDIIPPFEEIDSEVVGFIDLRSLTSKLPVKELPEQETPIGLSYIYRSGDLKRSKEDWERLLETL